MKEKRITAEFKFDFRLIGIATTLKEYRFCFFLNELLGCDFVKLKDQNVESKDRSSTQTFSVFKGTSANRKSTFFVFSNKNSGQFLLPELNEFDFLLMIRGEMEDEELLNLNEGVSRLNQVLLCSVIPPKKIKNLNRIVYHEEKPIHRLIKPKPKHE